MFWLLYCYYDIINGDMSRPSRGNSTKVSSFWPPVIKLDRALPVLNRLRLIIIILGTVYISRVLLALTKSLQLLQNHLLSSSKVSTCLNSRKQSSIWTYFDFWTIEAWLCSSSGLGFGFRLEAVARKSKSSFSSDLCHITCTLNSLPRLWAWDSNSV